MPHNRHQRGQMTAFLQDHFGGGRAFSKFRNWLTVPTGPGSNTSGSVRGGHGFVRFDLGGEEGGTADQGRGGSSPGEFELINNGGATRLVTDYGECAEMEGSTILGQGERLNGKSEQESDYWAEEMDSEFDAKNRISAWQAGWNVTNAIQGMFLVSCPYAVFHGGYWAIIAFALVAYICCHTGRILVDCLYEQTQDGAKVRVRDSYSACAEAVWGKKYGVRLVSAAQLVELLMTCILYLVLCGDLMIGCFPNGPLDHPAWTLLSSVLLLPCAMLKTLRHVSFTSLLNTVIHVVINSVILIYCLTRSSEWKPEKVQFKIDIWTFPISLGIIVFSYTSQIFLPSLEGGLVDKSRFRPMLYITHIAAALTKSLFGYLCFLTFQEATQEVVTNNLPSRGLKIVVNMALVIKAILSYPLPYYATIQILETSTGAVDKQRPRDGPRQLSIRALLLRLAVILFTLVMAVVVPHFAILMGLIGSFTGTMLSFVWPAYFHLKLKGREMGWLAKGFDLAVILAGFFCGFIGIYYSGRALHRVMRGEEINPFRRSVMPIFRNPLEHLAANVTLTHSDSGDDIPPQI